MPLVKHELTTPTVAAPTVSYFHTKSKLLVTSTRLQCKPYCWYLVYKSYFSSATHPMPDKPGGLSLSDTSTKCHVFFLPTTTWTPHTGILLAVKYDICQPVSSQRQLHSLRSVFPGTPIVVEPPSIISAMVWNIIPRLRIKSNLARSKQADHTSKRLTTVQTK